LTLPLLAVAVSDHLFVAVPFGAYLVAVVAAAPLVATAFLLQRLGVRPFRRALVAVATIPLVGLLVLAGWLAVAVAPLAAVDVSVRAVPVWVGCWAVPLALATLAGRRLGLGPERALRRAAGALPVGLAASLGVFVAPGGAVRYNITFLTGTEAAIWWSAFALTLLFVPGLLVAASARVSRPK
jgi:hypothetical protein